MTAFAFWIAVAAGAVALIVTDHAAVVIVAAVAALSMFAV